MGARAPTPITVRHAPQHVQLAQLIERSAFVRSRRNGSSTVDQDSHAEPKISAGAAELVENRPRAANVAFDHRAHCWAQATGFFFYKVFGSSGDDAWFCRVVLINSRAAAAARPDES